MKRTADEPASAPAPVGPPDAGTPVPVATPGSDLQPLTDGPVQPRSPLISVLVRSTGRSYLQQALASVAAQSHDPIELVVVAASADHPPLPDRIGTVSIRLVQGRAGLSRSQAANTALDAARGDYLMFLDDDDWLMPGHLARLATVLQSQSVARVAYTGIALVDSEGRPLGQIFDMPFDPVRQLAGNLTPIHSVLFDARLRDAGCRFDEALDRYEDWDFWLQLASRSTFIHLPGVSAVYRIHESSGVHADAGARGGSSLRVYQKWQDAWSPQQLGSIMERVWAHAELSGRLLNDEIEYKRQLESATRAHHETQVRFAEVSRQFDRQSAELKWHLSTAEARLTADRAFHEEQLSVRHRISADLERQLSETTALLAEARQQLIDRSTALAAAEGTVATLTATSAEQRTVNEGLAGELAQTRQQLDTLRRSRVWRLTAPLRRLTARIRRPPADVS